MVSSTTLYRRSERGKQRLLLRHLLREKLEEFDRCYRTRRFEDCNRLRHEINVLRLELGNTCRDPAIKEPLPKE